MPFELGLKGEQDLYRSFWVGEECFVVNVSRK